jgi:hypothetical protein
LPDSAAGVSPAAPWCFSTLLDVDHGERRHAARMPVIMDSFDSISNINMATGKSLWVA